MKRKPPPHQDLLRARFEKQMSRTALSRKSGVSGKTIWQHETKGGWVRMENAKGIAKALGCKVEDIYDSEAVIG